MKMKIPSHPVPTIGDTVVLNDHGLAQIFGTATGLSHMKTLQMKIIKVDPKSLTEPEITLPVWVDNKEINHFLLDHWCFDVVRATKPACEHLYSRSLTQSFPRKCRMCGEPEVVEAVEMPEYALPKEEDRLPDLLGVEPAKSKPKPTNYGDTW